MEILPTLTNFVYSLLVIEAILLIRNKSDEILMEIYFIV